MVCAGTAEVSYVLEMFPTGNSNSWTKSTLQWFDNNSRIDHDI